MNESYISKSIAESMIKDSGFIPEKSKSGSLLFFNENYLSSKFATLFNIKECKDKFEKAFRIVTEGVGNEKSKVNSITSSSLLSLLTFFKLFENPSEDIYLKIRINEKDYFFTQVLFEIRNKVVGYPSCVDVVLADKDGCLLFLESKFTEFITDRKSSESFGISYLKLYNRLKEILSDGGLMVEDNKDMTVLYTKEDKYIYGIKQSISHLIGLVKGPQDVVDGVYDEEYLGNYKDIFSNAPRMFYGTILFDPKDLKNVEPQAREYFIKYKTLYEKVIGNHGEVIIKEIENWCKKHKNPKIEVLNQPLTYQTLLSDNYQYKESLPEKVKEFYHFK